VKSESEKWKCNDERSLMKKERRREGEKKEAGGCVNHERTEKEEKESNSKSSTENRKIECSEAIKQNAKQKNGDLSKFDRGCFPAWLQFQHPAGPPGGQSRHPGGNFHQKMQVKKLKQRNTFLLFHR
jgi:hypothetical protein